MPTMPMTALNSGRGLEGKVAWITGAASGIGLATAQRFAAEGAVVIGSDIVGADAWETVAQVAPNSGFHIVDVRDGPAQADLVGRIVTEHGRLDAVVTAAGVAGGGQVHSIAIAEWDRVQDINLKGTMLSCRAALAPMIEARSGAIITIASVEGLEGCEAGSTYNASKGAVVLLTKNMASDYGRIGIRANAICPGFIETPMFRSVIPHLGEIADRIRDQHKLGRWGRPSEIASAAYFLASDDSSFITGVALPVDGGYTAGHAYGLALGQG